MPCVRGAEHAVFFFICWRQQNVICARSFNSGKMPTATSSRKDVRATTGEVPKEGPPFFWVHCLGNGVVLYLLLFHQQVSSDTSALYNYVRALLYLRIISAILGCFDGSSSGDGVLNGTPALKRTVTSMFGLRSVMWGMFWSCIAALIAWTVMVLFGAPLFDLVERTWLAAIAFALIALFPVGATLKGDGDLWMHVFRPSSSTSSPIQSLVTIPLVGATIGAWASAVALPLDWQTEWQRWPVASNYGALIGYQIGLFAAIITCKLQSKHGD